MFQIQGHSDDVVSVMGEKRGEVSQGTPIVIGTVNGGIVVTMVYPAREGRSDEVEVWEARVHQIDEDKLVPWPVTITNAAPNGYPKSVYSVLVVVDCPAGTPIAGGKFSP